MSARIPTYAVGDRYQFTGFGGDCFFIIETIDTYSQIIVESNMFEFPVGRIAKWPIHNTLWQYIGNFAKSRNFNNLYNLLNEA